MDKPQPYQLWKAADGDVGRYMELLVEHGHIIPRELEGDLSDNERLLVATRRERAEAEARDLRRQFDAHELKVEDSRASCSCGLWTMAVTGDGPEVAERHAAHVKSMVAKFETSGGTCQFFRATAASGRVTTGIICGGRNSGRKRCQVCKQGWSVAQCDYPVGGPCKKCKGEKEVGVARPVNCHDCAGTGRAMCNRHLCGACRAKGPGQDEDYCPEHARGAGVAKPPPTQPIRKPKLKREECRWVERAQVEGTCLHKGCPAVVRARSRCLYFPVRRRAMCEPCGKAYLDASG